MSGEREDERDEEGEAEESCENEGAADTFVVRESPWEAVPEIVAQGLLLDEEESMTEGELVIDA